MNSIVIDMDDTICYPNHDEKSTYFKYTMAEPNMRAIEKIKQLKSKGFYVIIYSARRMLTHDGDIEKIEKDVGAVTREWLTRFKVPYDELIFGKPYSKTYYVDDKAMNIDEFYNWEI